MPGKEERDRTKGLLPRISTRALGMVKRIRANQQPLQDVGWHAVTGPDLWVAAASVSPYMLCRL